jgi:hypothetical protein
MPSEVTHFPNQKKCALCGETIEPCSILNNYLDQLFCRLITSKELRMQWLYIPH